MTLSILLSTSITVSLTLILLTHPLTMSLMLLMQTFTMTVLMSYINLSSWFSYIMFIIMIGGMLVLFIYMTSIASNEKFKFSAKIMLTTLMTFMISTTVSMENFLPTMKISNMESYKADISPSLAMTMTKYFSMNNVLIMLLIILFLLITLIAVVKITNVKYGALRQSL